MHTSDVLMGCLIPPAQRLLNVADGPLWAGGPHAMDWYCAQAARRIYDDCQMSAALLIWDAQRNVLEGPEPVPDAETVRPRLERLLASAGCSGRVIVHVQNDGQRGDPDEPGSWGWELVFEPSGDETVVRKSDPNVFGSNPQLAPLLREQGI